MTRTLARFFSVFLFLAASSAVSCAAQVREIRLAQHNLFTRTVIELDKSTDYSIENHSEDRGYVTVVVQGVEKAGPQPQVTRKEEYVKATRVDFLSGRKELRLHLKTPQTVKHEHFTLEAPNRIVVDLFAVVQRASVENGSWKRRIIIDPGHGGKDPGAVGKVGSREVHEKEIVTAVAKDLARLLQADPRFEIEQTRSVDKYVSLTDRTHFAAIHRGDLFISIHTNAVGGSAARRARGFEIWTWNRDSNHSAAAKAVSRLENAEYEISRDNSSILTQMMEDALESQALVSRRLASAVHQTFMKDSYFRRHDRGINKARFKVLENYDMPSILVEMGFISHPDEARLLHTRDFQRRVARHLYLGIIHYYAETDPTFPKGSASQVASSKP